MTINELDPPWTATTVQGGSYCPGRLPLSRTASLSYKCLSSSSGSKTTSKFTLFVGFAQDTLGLNGRSK
jgi:hypothetical protein